MDLKTTLFSSLLLSSYERKLSSITIQCYLEIRDGDDVDIN